MKDVASRKFKFNEVAAQDNLDEWYEGVTMNYLSNYRTCGVKHIGGVLHDQFKELFGKAEPPLDVDRCIRGHKILEQCYICPRDGVRVENMLIFGSECINKIKDGVMKGSRCEVCDVTHKNRNFNFWNEHKKCKQIIGIRFTKLYFSCNIIKVKTIIFIFNNFQINRFGIIL